MKNKLLKMASLFITPILILFLLVVSSNYGLTGYYFAKHASNSEKFDCRNTYAESSRKMQNFIQKNNLLRNKQKSVMASKNADLNSSEIELIPGGESVGVRLCCRGILVVGFTSVQDTEEFRLTSNIFIGDMITEVNSEPVKTSKELINKVKTLNEDEATLTIIRSNEEKQEKVKLFVSEDGERKIGLWVRDTTSGVGTMTFYSKDKNVFGALGHPVIDGDTNECFEIKGGSLLKSSVISVRKGQKGNPGELKGVFIDDEAPIGSIETNTNCGIFGKYSADDLSNKEPLKVASRNEIEEGSAKIITTIDEEGPKEYDISIEKLYSQEEPGPKSMLIKITDDRLLSKTGGIVQGMSGSPIIQNGKIVGAVTHVLINKPDTGYGIYIDWMIQEADMIK